MAGVPVLCEAQAPGEVPTRMPYVVDAVPWTAAVGGSVGADVGGLAAGDAEQLGVRRGEDRVRVAGCGPDLVVAFELGVDQGPQRLRVGDRCDATDGETGVLPDELR